MARYVDAEKLIAEYDRVHIGPPGGARKLMVEAPTADVAEVKHGEWETTDTPLGRCCVCSVCGSCPTLEYNYCPYCGAKMDGERKEKQQC
jgi:hypothetical protein